MDERQPHQRMRRAH
jgi:hypothetical protein